MFGIRKLKFRFYKLEKKCRDFRDYSFTYLRDTVAKLWDWNNNQDKQITDLQAEIEGIHRAYREAYCEDCCHAPVCIQKPGMKYGYECLVKPEILPPEPCLCDDCAAEQ